MSEANGAMVPGKSEIVLSGWDRLCRCDARDGRELASTQYEVLAPTHFAVVAPDLVVAATDERLELRRIGDLSLLATTTMANTCHLTAARLAPRIAWTDGTQVVVHEVTAPVRRDR